MRFVHMADIHFDCPFTLLASRKNLANIRRLEQREIFKKAIEYVSENKIPFLFISGDLYEQEYVRESTIEYINNLFKTIPETKIFISPGNHDPFLKNSFYNTFCWNNNVTIFNSEIKIVELEDVDIYGYGFSSFYCNNSEIENIKIKNKNKINILVTHGSLDASKTLDMQYNPINSNKLKEIGFDYVALGHIHKNNYLNNKNNFIYPGSIISLGFDEPGEHGILDIELNKKNNNLKNNEINNLLKNNLNKIENKNNLLENNLNNNLKNKKIENNLIKIKFIKLDNRIFEEKNINISEIISEEELIEKINGLDLESNKFYKIVLVGVKNIEINKARVLDIMSNEKVLKIEDRTEIDYDFAKLAEQKNLKGIFVKKLLDKLETENTNESEIRKALEIGLKSFD